MVSFIIKLATLSGNKLNYHKKISMTNYVSIVVLTQIIKE